MHSSPGFLQLVPRPPCRWVPVRERSRSLSLVYSGMYTGSMLGLALSPQVRRCAVGCLAGSAGTAHFPAAVRRWLP